MASIKINNLKIHIEELTDNQMQEVTGAFNYPGLYTYPTTWWPGLEFGYWNRSGPTSIGVLGKGTTQTSPIGPIGFSLPPKS